MWSHAVNAKVRLNAKQLQSILTTYSEDTALSVVEGMEEHGWLAGLESWRRLYSDQKGTLTQRTNTLRELVLYPERVNSMSEVVQAITRWEKAYGQLLEASKNHFKLDEHGKISALKRMVPQEIT